MTERKEIPLDKDIGDWWERRHEEVLKGAEE